MYIPHFQESYVLSKACNMSHIIFRVDTTGDLNCTAFIQSTSRLLEYQMSY